MKTSFPKCPKCECAKFELRIARDEAVAAAHCTNCAADYLLLDSEEYWFDVIQNGYPRLTRCSCKHNNSFRLRIDYWLRTGPDIDYAEGDIRYIEVHSICSVCSKTRRQMYVEVDYSGTDHLFNQPLVPCKNPKILYDLKNLNLLLTLPDMLRIADHLASEAKCAFISCVRKDDMWINIRQGGLDAKATIERLKYLFIYATPGQVEVPQEEVDTIEDSIKKENSFWKRSEVIRIGSKTHACITRFKDYAPSIGYSSDPPTHPDSTEVGLSFNIDFSNEFVCGEEIVPKSERFRHMTAGLVAMLKKEFVSWRGPHCFDNPDVNVAIFGERFRIKSRSQ